MTVRGRRADQVRVVEPVRVSRIGKHAHVQRAEQLEWEFRARFDFHLCELGHLAREHLARGRLGSRRDTAALERVHFGPEPLDLRAQRRQFAREVRRLILRRRGPDSANRAADQHRDHECRCAKSAHGCR